MRATWPFFSSSNFITCGFNPFLVSVRLFAGGVLSHLWMEAQSQQRHCIGFELICGKLSNYRTYNVWNVQRKYVIQDFSLNCLDDLQRLWETYCQFKSTSLAPRTTRWHFSLLTKVTSVGPQFQGKQLREMVWQTARGLRLLLIFLIDLRHNRFTEQTKPGMMTNQILLFLTVESTLAPGPHYISPYWEPTSGTDPLTAWWIEHQPLKHTHTPHNTHTHT